jgi:hypothetical protein
MSLDLAGPSVDGADHGGAEMSLEITLEHSAGYPRLKDTLGTEHVEQLAVVAVYCLARKELGHRAFQSMRAPPRITKSPGGEIATHLE